MARTICRRLILPAFLALALGASLAPRVLAVTGDRELGLAAPVRAAGNDARGLRVTLVAALTLALACGVVLQYQALSEERRRPAKRRTDLRADEVSPGDATPARAAASTSLTPRDAMRAGTPYTPDRSSGPGWEPSGLTRATSSQPREHTVYSWERPAQQRAPARVTSPADEHCAQAVATACVYNRAATVRSFLAALGSDPAVRPALAPGFWEMPSSGHADLARAYLRCGRALDARSVLTIALLTFGHNRELETLLHDTSQALTNARGSAG